MAGIFETAEEHLRTITECPICMFTDPRMLTCIHTFCFECLNRTGETAQKNPGDKMPCPLCRKEFMIPENGTIGMQKNVFMENLLEFKTAVQLGSATIICDMCNIKNEGKTVDTSKATMRCMEGQDYYCGDCVKVHHFQTATKDHKMVNIGNDMKSVTNRFVSMKFCTKHIHKPLDYYCSECKNIVCVSCFVESHKLHDCKDVTTVDKEFRETIEKNASKISTYANKMLLLRNDNDKRKADFLKDIVEKEKEMYKRNQELKDMIDRHTKSLLDELLVIKSVHLKEIENHKEEIDRYCTILGSFEAYCTELTLKGSASDICSSVEHIIVRADELYRDLELFIGRPRKSAEVSLQATDLADVLNNADNKFVGRIEETTPQYGNFAVVVGFNESTPRINDVFKINLHQPNDITPLQQIPTTMALKAVASVFKNTIYVAGIGVNDDEIWKYNKSSGWTHCASFVESRFSHCAAFIDEVLYICGGLDDSTEGVLDSVEVFNAVTNTCTTVGKLAHAADFTSNCVPYRYSLYIFGRIYEEDNVSYAQVYNTKENTCTLISKPMPRLLFHMRAILWGSSIILTGRLSCFIFDIEAETWQEREQFKTDVDDFGLVLEKGRLFVIGGGIVKWGPIGDVHVRYVPIQNVIDDKPIAWRIHGKLPKQFRVYACANIQF